MFEISKFFKSVQRVVFINLWKRKFRKWPSPPSVDVQGILRKSMLSTTAGLDSTERDGTPHSFLVMRVNLNLGQNHLAHHTDKFAIGRHHLVVRRGQCFEVDIIMDRPRQPCDVINLIFTLSDVDSPSFQNGCLVNVRVDDWETLPGATNTWVAYISSSNLTSLRVKIVAAASCPVGAWSMEVYTSCRDSEAPPLSKPSPFIYILFNPWCSQDTAFLEENHSEYVSGEYIQIWRGDWPRIDDVMFWSVDQHLPLVLECALYLIQAVGHTSPQNRGNPIAVTRALSSAVNSANNEGVIAGHWDSPLVQGFCGSGEILQEYFKSKRPVKHGECWIYAAVLTTVLRAIGLPSRLVTGYDIAHGFDSSLTCNTVIVDGTVKENFSLWNYHCWTEVWMKRPDLDESGCYDGWQVADGTPFERSDGLYQCGPASVAAIKKGEILRPFDTDLVLAEINSDCVTWEYNRNLKTWKVLNFDTEIVGKAFSTKAPGSNERLDITEQYKFPERSDLERRAVAHALRQVKDTWANFYVNECFDEFEHWFHLSNERITFGSDFDVSYILKNGRIASILRAKGMIQITTCTSKGTHEKLVRMIQFDLRVPPASEKTMVVQMDFKKYKSICHLHGVLKVKCFGKLEGTEHSFYDHKSVTFTDPSMDLSVSKPQRVLENFLPLRVEFLNPLSVAIKDSKLRLAAPFQKRVVKVQYEDIPAKSKTTLDVEYGVAGLPKEFVLTVAFVSKELNFTKTFLISNGTVVN